MPIYAYFTAVFFAAHKGLITFAMYLGGVLVAIIVAFVLSKTALRGSETTFIIELPLTASRCQTPYCMFGIKSGISLFGPERLFFL